MELLNHRQGLVIPPAQMSVPDFVDLVLIMPVTIEDLQFSFSTSFSFEAAVIYSKLYYIACQKSTSYVDL